VFVFSLVFFRADSVNTALHVLGAMFGFVRNGADVVTLYGVIALFNIIEVIAVLPWLVLLLIVALCLPNSQQLLRDYNVALDSAPTPPQPRFANIRWQPNTAWAAAIAIMVIIAFSALGGQSPFLYYQF
jgi:hypothetical protein